MSTKDRSAQSLGQKVFGSDAQCGQRIKQQGPRAMLDRTIYPQSIDKQYRLLAWAYDWFTDFEAKLHQEAVGMAKIKKNDKILEVAGGTGRATALMAKQISENNQLEMIDLTQAMLNRASQRLVKAGVINRVNLGLADARRLPFADNQFDILYNGYMFDLLDIQDMKTVLQEFLRVLKPGGRLILVNMSKNTNTHTKTLYEWLYQKGLLGLLSGGCRPVLMKSLVQQTGFQKVVRIYRKHTSWFLLNYLTGTEIVTAIKPSL